MQGACSGCPSSTATLKHGIEGLLKHYVPEVIEVRAAVMADPLDDTALDKLFREARSYNGWTRRGRARKTKSMRSTS